MQILNHLDHRNPGLLVRGLRPNMTMMSQNSQRNGQPRENCNVVLE
jgi:hypothetical protein